MGVSQSYFMLAVLGLLIIFVVLFVFNKNKKPEPLSPRPLLAFLFILLSFFFEGKYIVYGLIGIGVLIAVSDILIRHWKGK